MAALTRWAAVVSLALLGPATAHAQTSLSIYSDGRTVVRRILPQPLAKGRNDVSLELENVDVATVFSPDTLVTVASSVLRLATDRSAGLRSVIGQTLSFVRGHGDTVRATVIRVTPPQYKLADGRLLLADPGEPLFPSDAVRTTSQAALVLDAVRARPQTDLAYVTEGGHWSATYQVLLEPGATASISGTASIVSQGVRAESAVVQLVAGTIARARSPAPPPLMAGRMAFAAEATAPASPGEEAVGETHVYTLTPRLSIEPGVPVTTALFPRATAPVVQELIVPGVLPFRGYPSSGPTEAEPNRVPVQVWYTVKRPRGSAFGDRPLPGGVVQIYASDSAGRVQLIGEAETDHSAPGRDLRVRSGDAFDVTAERVQTDYTQEQIPAPRRGLSPRQRITASYRVAVSNAKPDPVAVDIREVRGGTWSVVTSSVPPEKLSATEMRFRLPVPARGEATLTYTVQVEQ